MNLPKITCLFSLAIKLTLTEASVSLQICQESCENNQVMFRNSTNEPRRPSVSSRLSRLPPLPLPAPGLVNYLALTAQVAAVSVLSWIFSSKGVSSDKATSPGNGLPLDRQSGKVTPHHIISLHVHKKFLKLALRSHVLAKCQRDLQYLHRMTSLEFYRSLPTPAIPHRPKPRWDLSSLSRVVALIQAGQDAAPVEVEAI